MARMFSISRLSLPRNRQLSRGRYEWWGLPDWEGGRKRGQGASRALAADTQLCPGRPCASFPRCSRSPGSVPRSISRILYGPEDLALAQHVSMYRTCRVFQATQTLRLPSEFTGSPTKSPRGSHLLG